jgi:hypothetical protein
MAGRKLRPLRDLDQLISGAVVAIRVLLLQCWRSDAGADARTRASNILLTYRRWSRPRDSGIRSIC